MIIHTIIALAAQLAIALATGDWWLGAAWGAALFVGREIAQAEYRWIERFGHGRRANLPLLGGFDRRVWNAKSLLDWIAPAVAVVALAAIFG